MYAGLGGAGKVGLKIGLPLASLGISFIPKGFICCGSPGTVFCLFNELANNGDKAPRAAILLFIKVLPQADGLAAPAAKP